MKLSGIAAGATLATFAALGPASLAMGNADAAELTVTCDTPGRTQQVTVREPGSSLQVTCPSDKYAIEPAPLASPEAQQVYTTALCQNTRTLSSYCPGATGWSASQGGKPGLELKFPNVPAYAAAFYIQCQERGGEGVHDCLVEVLVGTPGARGSRPGAAAVQICEHVDTSITVSVPSKGSSTQFSCEKDFVLYPEDANKVFSEDCTSQQNLEAMTRSETQGSDGTPTVYTLTAKEKPPKQRLCYLCARGTIAEPNKGSAQDYCVIYVQSSARTQSGLGLRLAATLPCLLALLHLTGDFSGRVKMSAPLRTAEGKNRDTYSDGSRKRNVERHGRWCLALVKTYFLHLRRYHPVFLWYIGCTAGFWSCC